MNVFYFVNRWPKNKECARSQKIYSMMETFINIGHQVFLLSSDTTSADDGTDLGKMPIETIYVNPNKIASSLASATKKPDIAVFNSYLMEQMYSIFLYSKYNKCSRILQINHLHGLETWRKKNYTILGSPFLQQYDILSTPGQQANINEKFNEEQLQSIKRSDFYFCGNDFISYYLKNNLKLNNYIIHSMGLPLNDFHKQINDLQYRHFRHRKNFVFIGNLYHQKNIEMIEDLIRNIWSMIKSQLNDVELHIFGSGYNKNLHARKKQLQKKGIFLKGSLQDTQELQKYRALLYPVRYTTGTKGAIVQSWFQHTPVITTPIGAQGMLLETSDPLFSANQNGKAFEGFFKERIITNTEQLDQKRLIKYYKQNKLSQNINTFNFGGLCNSWTYLQFVKNAVSIYTDQNLWNQCLLKSRKSFLKHQTQLQMELNIKFGISQVQMAVYQSRRKKQYNQQWDKYIKSKQGYNKLHQKKGK